MIRKQIKELLKVAYFRLRSIGLCMLRPLLGRWFVPVLGSRSPEKILVIRLDRLGDMVLTLPLLAAVKRRWPSAQVTLLCRESIAPIVEHHPAIDRVTTVPNSASWFPRSADRSNFPQSVMAQLEAERFDLVIDPFCGADIESALIAWKTHGTSRVGFAIAGRGNFFTHAVVPTREASFLSQQEMLLSAVGIHSPIDRPHLIITKTEQQAARQRLRDEGLNPDELIVGIHPGGYYATQRWPLGRFLQLANQLEQEDHRQVAFFGTRAEERLIAQIGTRVGARVAIFFGLELRELLGLMSQCQLFVCNNSGPLHMAAAIGVPTVSTMGPTDPHRWWPVGDGHVVLRKTLWCSPCMEGVCPLGTHECLMAISVEEMLESVRQQLVRGAGSRKQPALQGTGLKQELA